MTKLAPYTYAMPPLASDAEGIEGYLVFTTDQRDAPIGKVIVALDHRGERLVMVERERLPASHDRRLLPWSTIDRIDVDDLTVELNVPESSLDRYPAPDPDKKRENAPAEATRLTELPEQIGSVAPDEHRAADTTWGFGVVSLSVLATITLLLALAVYAAGRDARLLALLAIPVAFLCASILSLYRARRRPYATPRRRA